MTHYSEGICSDGAAILKDGSPMPVEEIVAKLNRLAELEQEEPERVCCMCESSSGEICSRTVTTDDREQVVYMHKHSGRCVEALKADKSYLQQENQRLRERLDEGPDKREHDRCKHCGLPAEHLTVFHCIDDLWEHVREERAKVADHLADEAMDESNTRYDPKVCGAFIDCAARARTLAQAIREGRE